jgi:hypothetical protein
VWESVGRWRNYWKGEEGQQVWMWPLGVQERGKQLHKGQLQGHKGQLEEDTFLSLEIIFLSHQTSSSLTNSILCILGYLAVVVWLSDAVFVSSFESIPLEAFLSLGLQVH